MGTTIKFRFVVQWIGHIPPKDGIAVRVRTDRPKFMRTSPIGEEPACLAGRREFDSLRARHFCSCLLKRLGKSALYR